MSEIRTSKISEINGVRPYEGQYGKVFYFNLLMENGDAGSVGKKSETALKVGDSLTYTLEETDRGNKIKEVQQQQNGFSGGGGYKGAGGGGGGNGSKGGNESFALAYARDLIIALVNKSGKEHTPAQAADACMAVADRFYEWLEEKKK